MRRELWKRLGFGALCGLAGMAPLAVLFPYWDGSGLARLCGGAQAAELARLAAGAAWGAAVCGGTLFWRRERGTFLTNSLWNYLLTCAAFLGWSWLCVGCPARWLPLLALWAGFTGLYAIGWAVRWLTCQADVDAIRRKLGLPPSAPSPLRWRESLPYLLLAAALFLGLRPLCQPFDGIDVPLLTGLVLPCLAYPFAAAVAGFGAGRRCGVTPLLPPAVALAFLPNLLYQTVPYAWPQAAVYAALALAGNLLGAAARRRKERTSHEQTDPPL